MNQALVDKIAQAVLYEGYILYPYRPSVKTRQRWTFGGLYPQSFCEIQNGTDAWTMQTQCLVMGTEKTAVAVTVRFLHLVARSVGEISPALRQWVGESAPPCHLVESLEVGGKRYEPWQEAVERNVAWGERTMEEICAEPVIQRITFPGNCTFELLGQASGEIAGVLIRQQEAIEATVELSARQEKDGVFKMTVLISNLTPLAPAYQENRDAALMRSLISTHTILSVREGQLISAIDPPEHLRQAASACRNIGTWPVLVGNAGEQDTMLSSPIILYDYPEIAPESPGDLFDATEIDEILTLRIMTLTDEEKRAADAVDPRASALLARTEALAREQLMGLHGTFRGLKPVANSAEHPALLEPWEPPADPLAEKKQLEKVLSAGIELKAGDRVRLKPNRRADIFDLALKGKIATIAAIEQDYENRIHVAVSVDDDPGRDLGQEGKIGHRFFFQLDEVEPV